MNKETIKENGPFFRGKVIVNYDDRMDGRIGIFLPDFQSGVNNSEDSFKGKHLGNIEEPNFITAYSMLGINQSKNDEQKYQTNGGKYSTPRKGSYVVVFFLNNDPNQCYYFPKEFSLPFPDQKIYGMNLSGRNKKDFNDILRKVNLEINEFHNGNIIGVNNNDDSNEIFIIFDNGMELSLGSPIEELSPEGNFQKRKSNLTRPSFFQLLIKRKDSFFNNFLKLFTTQKESEIEIGVEKKNLLEKGVGGNYSNNENSPEIINGKTSYFLDKNGAILTKSNYYKISDKEISSTFLNTINENFVSETDSFSYYENGNENYSLEKETIVGKDDIGFFENINSNYNLKEKQKFTQNISSKIEKFSKVFNKIVSIFNGDEREYSSSETINEKDDEYLFLQTHLLKNDKYFKSIQLKKRIDDDLLIFALELEKTFDEDENKRNTLKNYYTFEGNNIIHEHSLSNDKFSTVFKIIGTEEESHEITLESKSVIPNPADPSGTLELPNLSERGHKFSMKVTEDESLVRLETIGKINDSEPASQVTMGQKSFIEWKESGSESEINIELKNANPLGGIKLSLKTSDNKVILELPSGNIEIKAPLGDVTVDAMNATVNTTKDATIKSALNANIEAINTNIKSTGKTIVEGLTVDVNANVKATINAPIIRLGNRATMPAILSAPLISWLTSHTHLSTSPTNPTSPPVAPPIGVLSSKVFNS